MSLDLVRVCAACNKANRIPPKHLAHVGRRGSCKGPLPPSAEPLAVDEATFDAIVSSVDVPVLVDFWAEWCGPCRMAAPEVARVAAKMQGRALVLKVDTDREQGLAARYRIRGIPNFAVFSRGQVVHQQAGLVGADVLERWIRQAA